MTHQEALSRLDQRRRWLTERINAKRTIGWDVEYDISERDALARILQYLTSYGEPLTDGDSCYDEEKTT